MLRKAEPALIECFNHLIQCCISSRKRRDVVFYYDESSVFFRIDAYLISMSERGDFDIGKRSKLFAALSCIRNTPALRKAVKLKITWLDLLAKLDLFDEAGFDRLGAMLFLVENLDKNQMIKLFQFVYGLELGLFDEWMKFLGGLNKPDKVADITPNFNPVLWAANELSNFDELPPYGASHLKLLEILKY